MNNALIRLQQRMPSHIKPDAKIQSYEDLLALRRADEKKQLEHFSQQRRDWVVRNSGMSDRFKNCTFDNYVAETDCQKKAVHYAQRYADTFQGRLTDGKGFMFIGEPGTGKNHLASAIANHIGRNFKTTLILTVSDLVGLIRQSWSKDNDLTESQVINQITSVDLLVIDEVGLQKGSEDEHLQLTKIIDKRLYSFKPTSIISNCKSVEEIKHYIGFRAYDRLKEGVLFTMHFNWDSYRGKDNAKA
ncbi:ATP-binding protein [Pseudoalteromonas obscura]|uniref:ATP-binding protein n=1 Tax=Pseudoalteromonas obscura TaxID=3048491 RepID=A0ABT7EH99_9GAMM|nr:ATP-binding protein [Pseudoalteromonas sp. P94(2023)]MDK2594409.1 ATP-binding protein [Pseudoalteromonas sp. P94(2023)]